MWQIEATCKTETKIFAEYLNTNFEEDEFVNVAKATEVINQILNQQLQHQQFVGELIQLNLNSDTWK